MKTCLGFRFICLLVFQKKTRRKSEFFSQPNFPLGKSIKLKLILQIARGKRKPYIWMKHSSQTKQIIQVVIKGDLTFYQIFKQPYLSLYVVYFYICLHSSLSFLIFFLGFSPWLHSFLSPFKSHFKQIQKHVRLKQVQDSLRLEITHSWFMFSIVFSISYLK